MKLLPATALLLAAPLAAQQSLPDHHAVGIALHSGHHAGPAEGETLVFETVVDVPNASWSRLVFAEADLGARSRLVLTALSNGDAQHLDGESLAQWGLASGFFRGGTVRLSLYAAAGDEDVFVALDHAVVGDPPAGPTPGEKTLCGADDRSPSGDNRIGRLLFGGCTAWRATNGAFLTAGHCVDFDPDDGGPGLPDGMADLGGAVEFNVPVSLSDGTTQPALLDDQYAIDTTSFQWRFDGSGQGLGKDWGVFRVFPNSNTGLLPHEAYGLPFRVSRADPSVSDTLRITGFGSDVTPPGSGGDANAQNFTNQTDNGPYDGEVWYGTGEVAHHYSVDTTGGSSGSPVFRFSHNVTIGVHTNGGCAAGSNKGTSFDNLQLAVAMEDFRGVHAVHVDGGHPFATLAGGGSVFAPFPDFDDGVSAVPTGGVVSVVTGSYPFAPGQTLTIDRAMLLEAPVGSAVIGD